MAKLRVGAIEIDGHEVRINGTTLSGGLGAPSASANDATTAASSQEAVTIQSTGRYPEPTGYATGRLAGEPDRLTLWLASARLPRGAMALVGAALLATGVALLVGYTFGSAAGAGLDSYLGGMFVSSGLGLTATTFLAPWLQHRLRQQIHHQRGMAVAHVVARLRPVIGVPDRSQTVECLAHRAQIPVASAIRALAWMLEEGEIVEEIDDASDDFYYGMAPRQMASLADRLQHLSKGA